MADNTTLNLGAGGDVIASDDIAGVKHQQVKIEFGADGEAVSVSKASTANYFPVMNHQHGHQFNRILTLMETNNQLLQQITHQLYELIGYDGE